MKISNRTLNGILCFLAMEKIHIARVSGAQRNPVFYEYYIRKLSEGKIKMQALTYIMRRLVNIIYGMLKNHTEYRIPELPNDKAM